jgi:hypothetical protein
MNRIIPILLASLGITIAAIPPASNDTIPAGTIIRVRTNESIDASNAAARVFTGVVAQNVTNRSGRVIIPQGSRAELAVRGVSKHQLALDLQSITVAGRRYTVASSTETVNGTQKPGVGKNKRTAKYLGGGAAAGTVIGAIAGGGTGALVGGLLGGGAGAGVQTLTRGKKVHVPAESVLTFRLEQGLFVPARGR